MMWYIEWLVYEFPGNSKGRFAVYFKTEHSAKLAMTGWQLDHNVDRCEVKKL